MGMFDDVNFKAKCPTCGANMSGFQSKDGYCVMETIEPDTVNSFYSNCRKCKTWVEFIREPEVKVKPPGRVVPLTEDEVVALGFKKYVRIGE